MIKFVYFVSYATSCLINSTLYGNNQTTVVSDYNQVYSWQDYKVNGIKFCSDINLNLIGVQMQISNNASYVTLGAYG